MEVKLLFQFSERRTMEEGKLAQVGEEQNTVLETVI